MTIFRWIFLVSIGVLRTEALFWDLLSCPLCYLPRIEFPQPTYYPVQETPTIQQIPQVQYVYQRPIVKYIQPVKYVYVQQQPAIAQGSGYQTTYGGNGDYSSQGIRAPYRLSQKELTYRGYGGGSYATSGSSATFQGSNAVYNAPHEKKKTTSKATLTTTEKSTTEKEGGDSDELVEWEDEELEEDKREEKAKPKGDINEKKKNFHIHENIEGAGKLPESPKSKSSSLPLDDDNDLDILTTDDHMKPTEEELPSGGMPENEEKTEMIGIETQKGSTLPEKTVQADENSKKEMIGVSPEAQKDEFVMIGTDNTKKKLAEVESATAPPNLKKKHKEEIEGSGSNEDY